MYFKASLTGDEPEDVKQYHSTHPDFPHQSTPNNSSRSRSLKATGGWVCTLWKPPSKMWSTDSMSQAAYQSPQGMFQNFAAVWYAGSNIAPACGIPAWGFVLGIDAAFGEGPGSGFPRCGVG